MLVANSPQQMQVVTKVRHIYHKGVTCCPTCGHPIPTDDIAKHLPPRQRAVYEVVRDAGREGITRVGLELLVYGDDPHGGAYSNSVSVMICRFVNPRLRPHGLIIRSRHKKWMMMKIEEAGA